MLVDKKRHFLFFFLMLYASIFAEDCQDGGENKVEDEVTVLNLADIVERTFTDNLTIFEEYQKIVDSIGIWLQEAGRFDAILKSDFARAYERTPEFATCVRSGNVFYRGVIQKNATTTLTGTLEKRLRSGILVRPSIFIQKRDLPCPNLTGNCQVFNTICQIPNPITTGQLGLTVEIPLLKNAGYQNIGAGEIAARFEYQASVFNWKFEVSRVITGVASAFWNYGYAIKRLDAFQRAFNQTQEFLDGLQKMIAAGEVAATEAHQVITDLETRRSNVDRAIQDIFQAKQTLLLFMNIDAKTFAEVDISRMNFFFPDIAKTSEITPSVERAWIDYALSQRADYIAFKYSEEGALALVRQAINALEPELNINVDVYSKGIERGHGYGPYFRSLKEHAVGVNAVGTVSLTSPICYTFERGVLQSRMANLKTIQFKMYDLENTIQSQVLNHASAIRQFSKQLAALLIATREADTAVVDEIKKFLLGASTVFDIIQLKDRALNTELALIDVQYSYIVSIIELHFFMGMIYPPFENICHINEEELLSLPPT